MSTKTLKLADSSERKLKNSFEFKIVWLSDEYIDRQD